MDATISSALVSAKADWCRAFRLVVSPFRIRDERASDVPAREVLLDSAFGPARFAKTCERLREGRKAASGLSLVAVADGALVGTVRLWDVEIGDRASLMLGPLAVDGRLRAAGIGAALMDHALRRARKLGHESVILVGDAPYYARFGFDADLTQGFVLPGPVERDRFLGLELARDGLKSVRGRIVATGALVEDGRRSRRAA